MKRGDAGPLALAYLFSQCDAVEFHTKSHEENKSACGANAVGPMKSLPSRCFFPDKRLGQIGGHGGRLCAAVSASLLQQPQCAPWLSVCVRVVSR